ncbi:MAG: type II toxin-antitoxin system VapB family antitoxin [Microbacteriaceae bacterium]|nr:type II toxin-antitoxin system VapB family antitoxin [Microbacteriaceae bacterium]
MTMGLNIKDDETVALVAEVARQLGTTKTGAVRDMARQKLADLHVHRENDVQARIAETTAWLEEHIWPHTAPLGMPTKEEIEEITGMNEMFNQ